MTRRAILLDLDGTLLDTAPDLVSAANELRAERGFDAMPLAELAPMCSYGGRGLLARGLDLQPGDPGYDATYKAFLERYERRMTQETAPYPGMREVITELTRDGWDWGVVTNKSEALSRPLMAAMAFDPAPLCIIGGDTAAAPKPDASPIQLGLEQIGADPASSIYVGDSDRDITAGRAAGTATIAAAYGYIPADEPIDGWQADCIVNNAGEIKQAVQRLAAISN